MWDQEQIDDLDIATGKLSAGLLRSYWDDIRAPEQSKPGITAWLSDVIVVPQFAAAASFLVAVMLTVGLMQGTGQPDFDDVPFDPVTTEIIPLLVTRGMTAQTVEFNEDSTTVMLVDAAGQYDGYRVTIRPDTPGAEPVWLKEDLFPTYPDSLAITMPGDLLAAGRYLVVVEGKRVTESGQESYELVQSIPFDAVTE